MILQTAILTGKIVLVLAVVFVSVLSAIVYKFIGARISPNNYGVVHSSIVHKIIRIFISVMISILLCLGLLWLFIFIFDSLGFNFG